MEIDEQIRSRMDGQARIKWDKEALITASSQLMIRSVQEQQASLEDLSAICGSSGLITPVDAAEPGLFLMKLCRWHAFAVVHEDSLLLI
jgi:predicted metal-dependent hydrolase